MSSVPSSNERLQVAPPEAVDRSLRKLAGQPVHGANGEKLGTIKDFVIDKQTGEVVYAVVSSGGILGAGNTLRLVPLHALQPAPAGTPGFNVKVSRATWDRSPELIGEAFAAGILIISDEQRAALASVYGAPPALRATADSRGTHRSLDPRRAPAEERQAATLPRTREEERAASPWVRATSLRGKEIIAGGQQLGEIEEIVVDLGRRSAAALVDVEDRILAGNTRALVPLTELSLATGARDSIATTLTGNDFAQLDPANRRRSDTDLLPTGRTGAAPTPVPGADDSLTSAARSARQALDNHAALARADIRVTTESGMLILRGRVPSEQLKEQAEDAVKQAASGVRLQNYLIIDPR